jgi:hypothetical protein
MRSMACSASSMPWRGATAIYGPLRKFRGRLAGPGTPAGKCDLTAGRSPRWRHTSPDTHWHWWIAVSLHILDGILLIGLGILYFRMVVVPARSMRRDAAVARPSHECAIER